MGIGCCSYFMRWPNCWNTMTAWSIPLWVSAAAIRWNMYSSPSAFGSWYACSNKHIRSSHFQRIEGLLWYGLQIRTSFRVWTTVFTGTDLQSVPFYSFLIMLYGLPFISFGLNQLKRNKEKVKAAKQVAAALSQNLSSVGWSLRQAQSFPISLRPCFGILALVLRPGMSSFQSDLRTKRKQVITFGTDCKSVQASLFGSSEPHGLPKLLRRSSLYFPEGRNQNPR